jgi:hypothetical protein
MWWISARLDVDREEFLIISYFHINPDTKKLEVRHKTAQDEAEFCAWYLQYKCL